jgi:hypothetical protein
MTEDDEMNDRADNEEDFVSGAGHRRAFDDDRLLAFALGLERDPELESATADDAVLRDRLEAMRADLDAVAAGLDRVVPAPPDDYTDLGDERWGELREFVTAPAPAAPRRRPTWLRVLAPAAAIALVLVAGVVGLQRLGETGGTEATTTGATDKAAESSAAQKRNAQDGPAAGAVAGDGVAVPSFGSSVPDPAAYSTIVVARAQAPAGSRQRFAVERVLKGKAGEFVTLRVTDRAAATSTLNILYLRPTVGTTPTPVASPVPSAQAYGAATQAPGTVLEFRYKGETALARQLPGDTDPSKVTLP